jgi:hypothetical protein
MEVEYGVRVLFWQCTRAYENNVLDELLGCHDISLVIDSTSVPSQSLCFAELLFTQTGRCS